MFVCRIFESTSCLLQENVVKVSLPTSQGEYEVLSLHMPLVKTLRPGIARLYKKSHASLYVFVSGGLFFMEGDILSLFTTKAVSLPDEKEETLSQALQHFSYHTLGNVKPLSSQE